MYLPRYRMCLSRKGSVPLEKHDIVSVQGQDLSVKRQDMFVQGHDVSAKRNDGKCVCEEVESVCER
jgi:hypothetical protein